MPQLVDKPLAENWAMKITSGFPGMYRESRHLDRQNSRFCVRSAQNRLFFRRKRVLGETKKHPPRIARVVRLVSLRRLSNFFDSLRHRKRDASLHVGKMQVAFCRGTFCAPPLRISFEASQMRCLLLFFGYCAVSGAGVSALMGPTRSARRSTQRSTPMAPLLRVSV